MIDDAHDLEDGAVLDADVCIVGAGPAGISMALALTGSGLRVLLLEAGALRAERNTQQLYAGTVADAHLHSPPDRYRERRFGGATTVWGGRCMPFDAIDFEARDYIPDSGWPFGRDQLLHWYRHANGLCEAGDFAYTQEAAFTRDLPPVIQGWSSDEFSTNTLERFSCPTDFGRRYAERLRAAAHVRVLLHANVTGLRLRDTGTSLESVEAQTLRGRRFSVRASRVVIAAGGLEVARLLLANRDVHRNGIGNEHDVVGRYYMCHLAGSIGALRLHGSDKVWHGYDISPDGVYCRRRIALRPEAQRSLGVGNFIARLHHPRIGDPAHRTGALSLLYLMRALIPYEYAKRLDDGSAKGIAVTLQHLRNVVTDPLRTFGFAWHLLHARILARRKFPSIVVEPRNHCYSLDFHAEQVPNRISRVTLGADRDALGLPQLHIDWRYTRTDVGTVSCALARFAQGIARSGIGHFDYDPDSVEAEMLRYGAYGGHHIGTARMGSDPRSSVTDGYGRVHGVENLYVAGSALFPTSSQANPTLTIVAMALRTAEHIQRLHQRHVAIVNAAPSHGTQAIISKVAA